MIGTKTKLGHARVETVHGFFFVYLRINFYGIAYMMMIVKYITIKMLSLLVPPKDHY